MNLFAYYSPDFFSGAAPVCSDGNTGETLRTGATRWNRAIGFTGLDDLVTKLGREEGVHVLGILCHGRPGGLRLLENGHVFTIGDSSVFGDRLRAIEGALSRRGRERASVVFLACASAAESQGTDLFVRISLWMPETVLVAFTRLLIVDSITPRDLGDGRICLPADAQVTDTEYDASRNILAQDSGVSREGWSEATAHSQHAVRFLDGRRLRRRRASLPQGLLRPTTTYMGRNVPNGPPGVLADPPGGREA